MSREARRAAHRRLAPFAAEPSVSEDGRHALPDLQGARILVVEDTCMVARMITDQLDECGCHVVGPATRLAEATSLATAEPLAGALLDVNLAGEESFPVARILRGRGVPFAFLTGYADDSLPEEFADDPCLTKPFTLEGLVRLVAERFGPGPVRKAR